MRDNVYQRLLAARTEKGGGFLLLIDPDKTPERQFFEQVESAEHCGVDAILVGTSFMLNGGFGPSVREIKKRTNLPVVIFPGSFAQITPDADAILFSSLISGRNPNYLIDEQIKGAPLVKRCGIEAIPTGYMLIESGSLTSVQFISGTLPIPRFKNDIACAHALAAQYLGMKLVYLEAGSGAQSAVPIEMVQAVAGYVEIPVMVGGGLRTPEDISARIAAGAGFVIVGTSLEDDPRHSYMRELANAAHPLESVTA